MDRIPLVSENPDESHPEESTLNAIFRLVREEGMQPIPNLYRALANAPAMLKAWINFAWPLRKEATTPRALRELVIMHVAQLLHVEYEWAHHCPTALASGVTIGQLRVLHNWRESNLFSDPQRTTLEYAEAVVSGTPPSPELQRSLRTTFSHGQVVEVALTAAFYVAVSRLIQALNIPIEPEFEQYLPEWS